MTILALAPWQLFPTMSGGQERCVNLLKQLDEVTVYSLNWEGREDKRQIGGLTYQNIPADPKAVEQARKLLAAGIRTYDAIPTLTKNNLVTIRKAIDKINPDIIILEHPWLHELIDDRPFLYDSHNCEAQNTAEQFGKRTFDYDLVIDIEKRAIIEAEHMFYTTERDLKSMRQLYNFETPTHYLPNGVTLPDEQAAGSTNNLLFVGSLYSPNVHAANQLIALAPQLQDFTIQIVGSCANILTTTSDNVQLIGQVTDKQLHDYFLNAYAFINPIATGSGSHLKIGRALSYGLPVITTPIGARGYKDLIETTIDQIPQAIHELKHTWSTHSRNARQQATHLQWQTIAEPYREIVNAF